MRILFVDDEAIIREGLLTLIEWDKIGFDKLLEAADAFQAMEIIEQSPPDVIITDIFMPEMSGIEFARKVKSEYPFIRFIILTGYEKFEYAKEAVEIGIAKYLVKPIFPDELQETVEAVVQEIKQEKQETLRLEEAKKRLRQYEPVITQKFWSDLITGTLVKEGEIRERAAMIQLNLGHEMLFVAAFKLNVNQVADRYGASYVELIQYAVRNIAEEVLSGKWLHFVDSDPSLLYGVFHREVNAWEFRRVLDSVRETLQIDICIGIGNSCNDLDKVSVSAREAEEAAHVLVMMEYYGVIHHQDIPSGNHKHVLYPYHQEKIIMDSLRYKEQLESQLMVPFMQEIENQNATLPVAKLMFSQLLGSVYRIANEYGIADDLNSFYDNYKKLNELETLSGIRTFFEELFAHLIELKNKKQSSFVDQLVGQAKSIMAKQFANHSLTVADIARQLSITPNYLSRIFHEKTGVTCVEYLTSIRLEEAKRLLVHSSLKSYEIAEKIGYRNAHYFSVLFKKHTGYAPSEYRKLHGVTSR